jgi:hypothetical protein
MEPKFAFTAQFWGDRAVVCRAIEDRPGPIVEQQFGPFATWTQANAFAAKLNEGLDLDPLDVRQIVTSSILSTACVVQAALSSNLSWTNSPLRLATRAVHKRFVLAELSLALTFCRTARQLASDNTDRLLHNVRNAVLHARQFMALFDGDYRELEDVSRSLSRLNAALQVPPLCGNE